MLAFQSVCVRVTRVTCLASFVENTYQAIGAYFLQWVFFQNIPNFGCLSLSTPTHQLLTTSAMPSPAHFLQWVVFSKSPQMLPAYRNRVLRNEPAWLLYLSFTLSILNMAKHFDHELAFTDIWWDFNFKKNNISDNFAINKSGKTLWSLICVQCFLAFITIYIMFFLSLVIIRDTLLGRAFFIQFNAIPPNTVKFARPMPHITNQPQEVVSQALPLNVYSLPPLYNPP